MAELNAIGPHIGDQADGFTADVDSLIKLLSGTHGLGGAETQFARGFLLQRRSNEGRGRVTTNLLSLDRCNGIIAGLYTGDGGFGGGLVGKGEFAQCLAIQRMQTRRESLAV